MNGKRKGLSLGTILAICLTMIVSAGCIWMFSKMRTDNTDAKLSAQKVVNVLGSVISGASATQTPKQDNIRTVTVTLSPTTSPAVTPSPTENNAMPSQAPAPSIYSFSMTFSGLIGFHSDLSDSIQKNSNGELDYQAMLANMSDSLNADFNTGVFPHVINRDDQKYADVLIPESSLDALKAAGFDDLLLNSEHALDQGVTGMQNTVDAIAERGFSCGGVNYGAANQNRMLQLNSAKIAMLTYTESLTTKGKNALATKAGQSVMTLFDMNILRSDILSAKANGANCIMVFLHWGKEDATTVTKEQKAMAQEIADMGADVIIGYHPSRVLPIEILESTDANGEKRQVLVVYSMGTLLTESRNGYDISGILLHLNISCTSNGNVNFDHIEFTPTYIWRQNINGSMQYRVVCSNRTAPEGMDQAQKEVMGRALNRIRSTLEDCPVIERKIQIN